MLRSILLATACLALPACVTAPAPERYDLIVRDGTIYDGSGNAPFVGDVAIRGDRIDVPPRLHHLSTSAGSGLQSSLRQGPPEGSGTRETRRWLERWDMTAAGGGARCG